MGDKNYQMSFTAEEIDEKLGKIDACAPKVVVLRDYGIDFSSLISTGGGSAEFSGTKEFWETLNSLPKEQAVTLVSAGMLGAFDVYPEAATRIYNSTDGHLASLICTVNALYPGSGIINATCVLTAVMNVEDGSYSGGTNAYAVVATKTIPG